MYPAGQHPIYPYTEEDRRIVLANAETREEQLQEDVEAIIQWVQKQPHLAEAGIEPHAALSHLLTSKGSVERAKQRIDSFYKERARSTQDMADRLKLLTEQYRPVWNTHIIAPAPKLYNGSRVHFMKVYYWDNYTTEELLINVAMQMDIRHANDLSSGEIYVIDFENATLGHILKLNHMVLGRAYRILKSLGVRIFAIHILNCAAANVIQAVLNLCKVFMSPKLVDRMKVHDTPEGIFQYLPKEYVLKDYGGDLPSYDVFREKMENLIKDEKTKQFLIGACKLLSDESKRPKNEYDGDYLPGNFKKLDLD